MQSQIELQIQSFFRNINVFISCSHYYNYYSISSGDLQALKNIRLVPGDAGANPTPNDLVRK
jgi:hypothetical protein